MILSTLFAASLLLTPPQYVPSTAVVDQAMKITATVMICEPVLPAHIVQKWLRLASRLGVSQSDVVAIQDLVRRKGLTATETVCQETITVQFQELDALLPAHEGH